ncbi:hypothetical protein M8C21_022007, partial [Ambrosia artemisiifolia]
SRASIVVLSKNYATSTWCLDELVLILQQRRECNHFVLPVFYGVEVTDIRNLKGNFDIQVKPSSKWTDDNVNKWRTALKQVADLAGHVLSGPETNFLREIVDTVYNKLDLKEVSLPLNIIGMAHHEKEINSWLGQSNLEFLVIYGMGGSGKSTLAKHIYDSNFRKFEYMSFLDLNNDLLKLQEQLLKDISWGTKTKIPCVSRVTRKIEKVLQMNRALIVLDDVTERSQLDALLGTGKINSQSKIIVTTRENTDKWFDQARWKCQRYEMKLLNDEESSQLLCLHAFGSKNPMVGFEEIVQRAIEYCEGNPMALMLLGSSLSMNDDIEIWVSRMRLWEREIDIRLQDILIRSYKSLTSDTVRDLFLHIACFFNGIDKDYVEKILEPNYLAKSGIQMLVDRGLLSVSTNKKLMMHRLLQEMGKDIVRKESIKLPGERSRVWLSTESFKILSRGTGSQKVEGLALDMHRLLLEEDFTVKVR